MVWRLVFEIGAYLELDICDLAFQSAKIHIQVA